MQIFDRQPRFKKAMCFGRNGSGNRHLNRDARSANMKNAFAVRPGTSLAGRRIVLVDDVFTTGATTNDCARALRDAGAAEVCVWTVARGL
jgi:predicted amidophosphoribosyltransferase